MSLTITLIEAQDSKQAGFEVYWRRLTHTCIGMAKAAGLYHPLWLPEAEGIEAAHQLIAPLANGLDVLKANPRYFRKLEAPIGQGTYDTFVPFVEQYLAACHAHPEARIRVHH